MKKMVIISIAAISLLGSGLVGSTFAGGGARVTSESQCSVEKPNFWNNLKRPRPQEPNPPGQEKKFRGTLMVRLSDVEGMYAVKVRIRNNETTFTVPMYSTMTEQHHNDLCTNISNKKVDTAHILRQFEITPWRENLWNLVEYDPARKVPVIENVEISELDCSNPSEYSMKGSFTISLEDCPEGAEACCRPNSNPDCFLPEDTPHN